MNADADNADEFCQLSSFRPPSVEELNEAIPAYEFLEFLDRGGMGAVYRAKQKSLDRIVAVKLLPNTMRNRKVFAERFSREARALALLNHPHIVSVYDFGEATGGCLYYVMEYVKGSNLRLLMKEGRTTSRRLLTIAMQVCEALQFAHQQGIVHRDVKPANILIDEAGRVKVADFGLAKVIGPSSASELTAASDALGTPDYMAPETTKRDHDVDHRADIYSLGVMLYEMLTGHVPKGAWEPPSRAVGADARFDEVVSRALQSDPQKRYQNISDISTAMRQLVQATSATSTSPVLDRVPPPPLTDPTATTVTMRTPGKKPRMPRMATAVLSSVVVLVGGFATFKDHPSFQKLFGPLVDMSQPASPPNAALTGQERQHALARTVFQFRGFVNVTTPFTLDKRMGVSADIHEEKDLPKGEFTIWRVSVSDQGSFNDEDLAGLIRACETADTVSNLNLFGTGVSPAGIAHVTRLAPTLTSLHLRDTRAFAAESLPFLAACKGLRGLFVSLSFSDGNNASVESELELVRQLRLLLPECEIHAE